MLLRILFNYILGYITIEVEGFFIERFINICKIKNILLWNIKRKNSTRIKANISIKDFKNIKPILRKTKCKSKIESKKGIPFIFNKYRKRKIFIITFLMIIFLMIIISRFIWNIEIIGSDNISKNEIKNNLEESGLKIGVLKSKVNIKDIINEIRLKRDDIAWMGIKLKGTNAIVEIVESDKKPEIIDENDYCNIISNKEGIIKKIDAQRGTALVKPGDVVKKGTILIRRMDRGKIYGYKVCKRFWRNYCKSMVFKKSEI